MSEYNGRRAPNFSQYLNDLNTIPSAYDQNLPQQQNSDLFDVDAELALFTNAEFLDFDPVGDMNTNVPVKLGEDQPSTDSPPDNQDVKYMDMLNDFNIPNYPYYSSSVLPMQSPAYPTAQPSTISNNDGGNTNQAISPTASQAAPTQIPPTPLSGTKLKSNATETTAAASIDHTSRHAQEEDKRRRNTAASARFRIKKKEREKNLERTVKDVTAKNSTLETRITQLEMENRWLKNLITEKNGSALSDGDLSGMFHKFQEGKDGLPERQEVAGPETQTS